ncbi:Ankyrin repeat [Dillenia turbinata]|uniref:Ankyrin repeat n=1 Tax=Dillenia turbinata TaxID=194707 RepID=A0AAN8VQV5_9MAGN
MGKRVLRKSVAGDTFREIGVLCYRPQPFTVRTTEISQMLRLNRTSLVNIMQANAEDGTDNHEQSVSDSTKQHEQTTLHEAVRKGHLEMVRILLDQGANANKADSRGRTPKAIAEQPGSRGIYYLLHSTLHQKRGHISNHLSYWASGVETSEVLLSPSGAGCAEQSRRTTSLKGIEVGLEILNSESYPQQ